jgi:hypothetical protein
MLNVTEFLKDINIVQTIAIGLILWFFSSRLETKIEKTEQKLCKKLDDLNQKLTDINRR